MFGALFDYFAGLTIGFVVGRNARNNAQIAKALRSSALAPQPAQPRSGWQVAIIIVALLGLYVIIAAGGH